MFFKSDGNGSPAGRRIVPALPLRDSIAALDEAMAQSKEIFLAAQRSAKTNDPTPDDIYSVGTLGTIVQLLRLADGTVKVLVEGRQRARVRRYLESADFFQVELEEIQEAIPSDVEVEALIRSVQSTFEVYVKLNKKVQPEVLMSVQSIDDASKLSDTIAANLPTIKLADRQNLLEMEEA